MKISEFQNFRISIFSPSQRSESNARETAIGALGVHFAAVRVARADLKCILLVACARLCALAYTCAPWMHVAYNLAVCIQFRPYNFKNLYGATGRNARVTLRTTKSRRDPDLKRRPTLHCASLG